MEDVKPLRLVEGQLQLTMTSIASLEDLGPFFASICHNVSRQQAKSHAKARAGEDLINAVIERDFLESWTAK